MGVPQTPAIPLLGMLRDNFGVPGGVHGYTSQRCVLSPPPSPKYCSIQARSPFLHRGLGVTAPRGTPEPPCLAYIHDQKNTISLLLFLGLPNKKWPGGCCWHRAWPPHPSTAQTPAQKATESPVLGLEASRGHIHGDTVASP